MRRSDKLNRFSDAWAADRNIGFTPLGLVLDGVTDNTAIVQSAFSESKVVRLPATDLSQGQSLRLGDIVVPTGCRLIGAGRPTMDRVSKVWGGNGTLIRDGRITVTGYSDGELSDFGIDSYARGVGVTSIQGKSDATRNWRVLRVATRSQDHGQLWEKNASTGNAAVDKLGDIINNILIEDCLHYDGPNGIAKKMRLVTVRRSVCFDVTVQAFVTVSDTINGSTSYSRARDVTYEDCDAIGCANPLHIYSRDNSSLNNAAGVLGADNIHWMGGRLGGALSNQGAHIGDPASYDATGTRIASTNVAITDALVEDNNQNGIYFQNVDGFMHDRNTYRNNGTAGGSVANSGVLVAPTALNGKHGTSNISVGTAAGYETLTKSVQAGRAISSGEAGITFTNYAATGAVALVLPPPVLNAEIHLECVAAQTISIASAVPGTNYIYDNGAAVAGNLSTNVRGARLSLKAMQSQTATLFWYVTSKYGTWTAT